jgi:hypothetical protein
MAKFAAILRPLLEWVVRFGFEQMKNRVDGDDKGKWNNDADNQRSPHCHGKIYSPTPGTKPGRRIANRFSIAADVLG